VLILLFIVLLASAVLVLGYGYRAQRAGSRNALQTVGQYGYQAEAVAAEPPRPQNLKLERSLADLARRFSPADYESSLRMRLTQAGMYGTRPSRFLMFRVLAVCVFAAVGLMYARGASSTLLALAAAIGAPYLGWMLPDTGLSMRINRRLAQIERDSADFIDLLAITVQAGLGLDQAIKVSADKLRGPLAEEARLTLNEIRVGQRRQDALRRLAERADTATMRSFARTMAQGETMGVSVADMLKALAVDARTRKRQAAEEMAQKAPIKMVFPLAICFFPAILIVAAGPGVLAVIDTLGGS
jgi:tight adherence protein C